MKNVTITLEEDVARWARIRAAELDTSVSKLVGEMLKEKMRGDRKTQQQAIKDFLNRPGYALNFPGGRLPKREEIYDRPGLRRFERVGLQEQHDRALEGGEGKSLDRSPSKRK
jgi:hypothetical protein